MESSEDEERDRKKKGKKKKKRVAAKWVCFHLFLFVKVLCGAVGILCEGCAVLVRSFLFFFTEPIISGPTMILMPIGTPLVPPHLLLYAHSSI